MFESSVQSPNTEILRSEVVLAPVWATQAYLDGRSVGSLGGGPAPLPRRNLLEPPFATTTNQIELPAGRIRAMNNGAMPHGHMGAEINAVYTHTVCRRSELNLCRTVAHPAPAFRPLLRPRRVGSGWIYLSMHFDAWMDDCSVEARGSASQSEAAASTTT